LQLSYFVNSSLNLEANLNSVDVAQSQCIHQLINSTQKYYCGARNGYLSYGSSPAYPNVESKYFNDLVMNHFFI